MSNQEWGLTCTCVHVVCIQLAHKPLREENTQHKPHPHCIESPSTRKNGSTLWSSTGHCQTGIMTSYMPTRDRTSLSPYSTIFLCFILHKSSWFLVKSFFSPSLCIPLESYAILQLSSSALQRTGQGLIAFEMP